MRPRLARVRAIIHTWHTGSSIFFWLRTMPLMCAYSSMHAVIRGSPVDFTWLMMA